MADRTNICVAVCIMRRWKKQLLEAGNEMSQYGIEIELRKGPIEFH